MKPDPVLSVEGVSKKFCRRPGRSLAYGAADALGETLGLRRGGGDLRPGEFWALRDVSFELRPGESLGIVGSNGSGKTTLLRLVAGLLKLDAGRVLVRGRVAPLIALGAGFHPLLTGRENVELNLSLLGMRRGEVREAFDEVVDFAELSAAIDAPLRTYSSGMQARLGFACAVFSRPDLLLIDETLAVGDMRFRLKCYRRLDAMLKAGLALVFVSHNPWALAAACESGLYLREGRAQAAGALEEVLQRYEDALAREDEAASPAAKATPDGRVHGAPAGVDAAPGARAAEGDLEIAEVFFRGGDGARLEAPATGEPATLCVKVRARRPLEGVRVTAVIRENRWEEGWMVRLHNLADKEGLSLPAGEGELLCRLPALHLGPGSYQMKLNIRESRLVCYDAVEGVRFRVAPRDGLARGSVFQPHRWEAAR